MATTAAQTAEQKLAAAHAALLKTPGIQFDFGNAPPPPPTPTWIEPLIRLLQAIGPVLKYVFWGGLILGAALILYFIVRELAPASWFKRKRAEVAVTDWRPEAETARALLEDADGLAAAGRFEEAIHLLLFRSIDDLRGRRPGAVKPALTSRDIAGLETLPAAPRDAFARLARAVELTFFGGRPADAEAFGAARKDYEAFAFAEGWR
ncbi:MAG: hypothetical protein KKE02_21230 [Alphaproteobacteria bacterium]|nr:hypothetical protein [Alphaproteobacteria bacterium]MBU1514443.1 hypothetical protein [Alphaproteobacteria bacterium]MBU2097076.1 hypothetical protein [Alphaproteobacteria bacterium]MBU2153555.1 hypothetical protein [Alphaproteobacteria bacterium]MBU2308642.1 hypothetical protein [Alphaproteobacteria bacterium]